MAIDDTPIVPIYDPDRGFRTWYVSQIYTGENDGGSYVPNVDDLVVDYSSGFWRCVEVDASTGLSKLLRWVMPKDPDELTNEDTLLGTGPGYQSESFRAYIDTSVFPHTMALDSRLHIYGSTAKWIKVFLGTNYGEQGQVISAYYDQGGTLHGENIPLELVATDTLSNRAIKTPMVGYTNLNLDDGEVVTAVVYDDVGNAISISKLLVKNTAFIRTTDASRKFITSIHLESPFISDADDTLVQYPVNMPVAALTLMGVVTYSDGSEQRYPVDGTKFSIHGLRNYIASIAGQRIPLVLSYYFDDDEYNYGAVGGAEKHMSVNYTATTLAVDEAYEIKLFAYPMWVDGINGYKMEFFLYNLNRRAFYNVTPHVRLAGSSPSFQPLNYTQTQHMVYTIDMNKVDSSYPMYRHVQTIDVALKAPGSENTTNWLMGFNPNKGGLYGAGIRADVEFVNVDDWKLKIDCGFKTQEEWIENLYYATEPLHNPEQEGRAPAPNYFVIVLANREIEYHVTKWNQEFVVPMDLDQGELLYIRWIHRSQADDLQLGISGLPIHQ